MPDQEIPNPKMPDPERVSEAMGQIAERSQRIVQEFVARQSAGDGPGFQVMDPSVVGRTFGELYAKLLSDPTTLVDAQMKFWQDYTQLWGSATRRLLGEEATPVIQPDAADRRFKDEAWEQNPVFDFIKQSYLLASRYVDECVTGADGLDEQTARKVEFYARQFVDAMAPTNFASTNPAVVRETVESGGENLLKGLSNMLDDLERGKGKLRIKMTALDKFELGENVAVTPGKVVYQNELMQLLQFTPSTETVFKRPLLIIPPWINKYYILDLRAKNSFIKWAVDEGHTVFVISWVNPDARLAEKDFVDYMHEGPLEALDAIGKATGERNVKAIGYCLGGTLLAATLAYLSRKGDKRIKCATYFTTMVDFANPGELGVFIDEEQLSLMEQSMEKKGYFEGASMAEAFNLLRANDLIWSFVVNNYLLGKEPFPFDLLYWNSDSTRMPRTMHSFYLRNMYQKNLLCQAGGITLDGEAIDLREITIPSYILSAKEDHIAPWKSTYSATQLYGGNVRFVLGASGHIAGVINPPAANKYGYWTNDDTPAQPEAWLADATANEGSWWTDWAGWVAKFNGKSVPARTPGDGKLTVLEDAPGSYVRARVD
jgi:polyhydroxyalkanoate synthase